MSFCDPSQAYHIVRRLKSDGTFDHFRKECLADIDTRPAYNNLRSRVASYVKEILSRQSWQPDMKRHELQEGLRLQIIENGMLTSGVEQIINRVLPKMENLIRPCIERSVSEYLGISPEIDFPSDVKSNAENGQFFAEFPPFTYDPHILEESDEDVTSAKDYGDFLNSTDTPKSLSSEICVPNDHDVKQPLGTEEQRKYACSTAEDFDHCSSDSTLIEKFENEQSSNNVSPQSCLSSVSTSRSDAFVYDSVFNNAVHSFDNRNSLGAWANGSETNKLFMDGSLSVDPSYTSFSISPTKTNENVDDIIANEKRLSRADSHEIRDSQNLQVQMKSSNKVNEHFPKTIKSGTYSPDEQQSKTSSLKEKVNHDNRSALKSFSNAEQENFVFTSDTERKCQSVDSKDPKFPQPPNTSVQSENGKRTSEKQTNFNKENFRHLKITKNNHLTNRISQRVLHSKHKSKNKLIPVRNLGNSNIVGTYKTKSAVCKGESLNENKKSLLSKIRGEKTVQFQKPVDTPPYGHQSSDLKSIVDDIKLKHSKPKQLNKLKINPRVKNSNEEFSERSVDVHKNNVSENNLDTSDAKLRSRENSSSQQSNAESAAYCLTESSDVDDYEIVKSNDVTKIRLKLLKPQCKLSASVDDVPVTPNVKKESDSSDDEPLSALKIKKAQPDLPKANNASATVTTSVVENNNAPVVEPSGRFLRTRQVTKNRRYYGSDYSNFSSDSSDELPRTKVTKSHGNSASRKADLELTNRTTTKKTSGDTRKKSLDKKVHCSSDEETLSTLRARRKSIYCQSGTDNDELTLTTITGTSHQSQVHNNVDHTVNSKRSRSNNAINENSKPGPKIKAGEIGKTNHDKESDCLKNVPKNSTNEKEMEQSSNKLDVISVHSNAPKNGSRHETNVENNCSQEQSASSENCTESIIPINDGTAEEIVPSVLIENGTGTKMYKNDAAPTKLDFCENELDSEMASCSNENNFSVKFESAANTDCNAKEAVSLLQTGITCDREHGVVNNSEPETPVETEISFSGAADSHSNVKNSCDISANTVDKNDDNHILFDGISNSCNESDGLVRSETPQIEKYKSNISGDVCMPDVVSSVELNVDIKIDDTLRPDINVSTNEFCRSVEGADLKWTASDITRAKAVVLTSPVLLADDNPFSYIPSEINNINADDVNNIYNHDFSDNKQCFFKTEERCLRSKSSSHSQDQSPNEIGTRRLRSRRSDVNSSNEATKKRNERRDSTKSKDHNKTVVNKTKSFVTELYWKPVVDHRSTNAKRKGTLSEEVCNKRKK